MADFRYGSFVGAHNGCGVVGVFACYLDDSDERTSSVATLAGYVARVDDWRLFEAEIRPIFDTYKISVLHTKELHDTKGDFKGWTRLKKEHFVSDIYTVAAKYVPFDVSVPVRKEIAKKLQGERLSHKNMSAFGLCFSSLVSDFLFNTSMQAEIRQEGLSFIVKSGHRNNAEIEQDFHRHKALPFLSNVLQSVTFAGKTSSRAIQLADFFAFHSRRHEAQSDRSNGNLEVPVKRIYLIAAMKLTHFRKTIRDGGRRLSEAESRAFISSLSVS